MSPRPAKASTPPRTIGLKECTFAALVATALLIYSDQQQWTAQAELATLANTTSDEKTSLAATAATEAPPSELAVSADPANPPNQKPKVRPTASRLEAVLLTNAVRLTVKFQNFANLTGDYRVNADETISFPVLGRVDVADMTCADFEQFLAAEVLRLTGAETGVTVEMAEYKPIFVTGFVSKAGAFPWQPGMTVLHAEAMAGGIYRPQEAGATLAPDMEKSRLRKATADLSMIMATLARLRAEQISAKDIAVPKKLRELVGVEADKLVAEQRAVFKSRRVSFEAQMAALQRGVKVAEKEFEGLNAQKQRLEKQLALRRELLVKLDGLYKKGNIRFDRSLEEQTRIADIEEKSTNVVVAITRVQGAVANLMREVEKLKQERASSIDAEIIKLERDQVQYEIDVDVASRSFRKLTGQDAKSDTSTTNVQSSYEIVRATAEASETIIADRFMHLKPGDVVVVGVTSVDADKQTLGVANTQ